VRASRKLTCISAPRRSSGFEIPQGVASNFVDRPLRQTVDGTVGWLGAPRENDDLDQLLHIGTGFIADATLCL
jgi:hypothetical protein